MTTKAGQHHAKINHEKLRLVFTCDGELYDLVKTAVWFHLQLRRLNQVKTGSLESQAKHGKVHCDLFILLLLLQTPTIWFSLDHKWRSHKRSQKKMVTLWFLWIQFCCAYDSSFLFSPGRKHSYNSDSITSENQLLKAFLQVKLMNGKEITSTVELKKKTLFIAGKIYQGLLFQEGQ